MNTADLLAFTRGLLSDDGVGQFLIADNIIYEYLADAQFTFALDTRCFISQLTIPTVIDQASYALPNNTLRVYETLVDGVSYPYMNRSIQQFDPLPVIPDTCHRYYRTDLLTKQLTLNPVPTSVVDIHINYLRGPAARISALVDPEIDEEYHTALAHYAVAQCEHIFDSELNIPRFAKAHIAIWQARLRQAVLHYRRLHEGSPVRFTHRQAW